MKFRGVFHPSYNPEIRGFNQDGGEFYIGFFTDDDSSDGMIQIKLTVWAPDSPTHNTFASLRVYHDGIKVLRELEKRGFLKLFEELKASTFYDVVQCFVWCNIPIMYHGGDEYKEMTPRKIYQLLYEEQIT
jgi:hypothetical protein